MAMNDISNEQLEAFSKNIEIMEDRKKAINDDITDAFKAYALNNDVKVQALKAAYKNWKAYNKNAEEFIETDTEADALTRKLIKQYQDEDDI